MLGMVDGNGHPYSWSAIFNGYNEAAMASCPYAAIPDYLGKQPKDTLGIEDAHVTHIWTDDPADAAHVAKASLIPNVVERPEDVIGYVDAVIIATDIGHEHVPRCRPFVEAGLPMFVDKPMVDNAGDLAVFRTWVYEGHAILSGSAMT
ncbi:MAG TPA: oxidoreductase, partial [Candidatus Hydrogenedentes bacterium]|nr:oxidoreductase [Candidatus Hydrogenedentota bacterium]